MQPTFKQVPPKVLYFSIMAVFIPNCAQRIAATYPPGPEPITATSYLLITLIKFLNFTKLTLISFIPAFELLNLTFIDLRKVNS
jgi:hypothetical protein